MEANDPALRYCWTELSADEVLTLLRDFAAVDPDTAATGFLDTHQWLPLVGVDRAIVEGGHPDAQYRRAGLAPCQPGLHYFTIKIGELPESVRTARQLRSWLYSAGVPDGAIGDIVAQTAEGVRKVRCLRLPPPARPPPVGVPTLC